ncbi:hypothetical protein GCK32_001518, partial [Trichostrongylus colubriformis]
HFLPFFFTIVVLRTSTIIFLHFSLYVRISPIAAFSSPDNDVFAAPLGSRRSTSKSTKSSWNDIDPETGVEPKDARRTHHRSLLVAMAVAAVVLIIVIFFIALLIYS